MQLIAAFDGPDGHEWFDNIATTSAVVHGDVITIYDDEGEIVATARLRMVGKRLVWRVVRGRRGKAIGDFPTAKFSV